MSDLISVAALARDVAANALRVGAEELRPSIWYRRLMALGISVVMVGIWAWTSIYYETHQGSVAIGVIYGSVQAITFVAAGAAGVGWFLNARLAESERRALAAERLAEQHRNDAAKGRSLAAALLAADVGEGATSYPGDEIRRQQVRFARLLFGDLVVQSPYREASGGPVPDQETPEAGTSW